MKMNIDAEKRGGRRENSGRKKVENKRILISVKILPNLVDKMRLSGLTDRQYIEKLIEENLRRLG